MFFPESGAVPIWVAHRLLIFFVGCAGAGASACHTLRNLELTVRNRNANRSGLQITLSHPHHDHDDLLHRHGIPSH